MLLLGLSTRLTGHAQLGAGDPDLRLGLQRCHDPGEIVGRQLEIGVELRVNIEARLLAIQLLERRLEGDQLVGAGEPVRGALPFEAAHHAGVRVRSCEVGCDLVRAVAGAVVDEQQQLGRASLPLDRSEHARQQFPLVQKHHRRSERQRRRLHHVSRR